MECRGFMGAWLFTTSCIWKSPRSLGGQASTRLGELVLRVWGTVWGVNLNLDEGGGSDPPEGHGVKGTCIREGTGRGGLALRV